MLRTSEAQVTRALRRRILITNAVLCAVLLVIVARLLELQIVRGEEYRALAQAQHYGGVRLPAKRGEILSLSSKTHETSILATNTTLAMVYVDPLITDRPVFIAETLSDLLVTEDFHMLCLKGSADCPQELVPYYNAAFDPMALVKRIGSGAVYEPIPRGNFPVPEESLPDITEVRRRFARSIEERISEQRVTFAPLTYGATKVQMEAVRNLGIGGIEVSWDYNLIFANPEHVNQLQVASIARDLSEVLEEDPAKLRNVLRSRPLRYVPIMRRLSPGLSTRIREVKLSSLRDTEQQRRAAPTREAALAIQDPLRSIALIPEHWRYYPDATLASHVVGFLNFTQEPQYGIERTFDSDLRGQEGLISSLSDPQGGQILTREQEIVDPEDGDTIVLTIDRVIQKYLEGLMQEALERFEADSGQAIVMDPMTGRILAMVNVPLFDSNNYGTVYEKEPWFLSESQVRDTVVEIYHPETNAFVVKAYVDDVFTPEGREHLSEEKRVELAALEEFYDLEDIARYYVYVGENSRHEVFPTDRPNVVLRYRNRIGVGSYLNRVVQEIYEPGSVLKPVTMAVALDQGEVTPFDIYDDSGPVLVDEYTIRNNRNRVYGKVTMTNCLEFSINTCMTSVSSKLGKKLFHRSLERFGFGRITGVELEDELPGEMLPWRKWSNALLATAAYGQGISATPLQVVTAYAALANGGRLLKPTIVDSIHRSDGTVERTEPIVLDQVITPETSATITAMLTSAVNQGFAKLAKVKGYRIAGKTGTSQIAGPGGKYETGTGSTVASFGGYAPIDRPRFVALVKFDRPRAKGILHGAEAAAPIFRQLASFIFDYYGIPPDER